MSLHVVVVLPLVFTVLLIEGAVLDVLQSHRELGTDLLNASLDSALVDDRLTLQQLRRSAQNILILLRCFVDFLLLDLKLGLSLQLAGLLVIGGMGLTHALEHVLVVAEEDEVTLVVECHDTTTLEVGLLVEEGAEHTGAALTNASGETVEDDFRLVDDANSTRILDFAVECDAAELEVCCGTLG